MLKIITKSFDNLTIAELYALLQLRSEIFVVEQDCVYQDIDYKDQKALHVLGYQDQNLVAYTRIFNAGIYFDEASIGRVLVKENLRNHKYGYDIMNASINAIEVYYGKQPIKISAQKYLKSFYTNLGFKDLGTEYLEDGIPHIGMIKQ